MANEQTQRTAQDKTSILAELVSNAHLAWRLMTDGRVALWTKLVVPALMGAYLVWPADLLPDVVPVLGQLDDLAVLLLSVRLFIQLCPADIVKEYRSNLSRGNASPQASTANPTEGEVVDGQYRVIDGQ